MKGVFQLIRKEDGRRSEPMAMELKDLFKVIQDRDDLVEEDYILLLTVEKEPGEMDFATAPLISIGYLKSLNEIKWKEEEHA